MTTLNDLTIFELERLFKYKKEQVENAKIFLEASIQEKNIIFEQIKKVKEEEEAEQKKQNFVVGQRGTLKIKDVQEFNNIYKGLSKKEIKNLIGKTFVIKSDELTKGLIEPCYYVLFPSVIDKVTERAKRLTIAKRYIETKTEIIKIETFLCTNGLNNENRKQLKETFATIRNKKKVLIQYNYKNYPSIVIKGLSKDVLSAKLQISKVISQGYEVEV